MTHLLMLLMYASTGSAPALEGVAEGEDSARATWRTGLLILGERARFLASGATPGSTVYFAVSPSTGSGPCPPPLDPVCIDLVNPVLLGSAVADAALASV